MKMVCFQPITMLNFCTLRLIRFGRVTRPLFKFWAKTKLLHIVLFVFFQDPCCVHVVCFGVWICGYAKLMWSTLGHNVWYAMSCPISSTSNHGCGTACACACACGMALLVALLVFVLVALALLVARRCIQVPSLVSTPWAPSSLCNCGEHCCQQKNEKALHTPVSMFSSSWL